MNVGAIDRREQQIRFAIYLQVIAMLVAVIASLSDVNAWQLSVILFPLAHVSVAVAICAPPFVLALTFQVRPSIANVLTPLLSAALSFGIFFGLLPGVQ